ncbi:MAG: HD domain-containing protein [Fimbriimonadaceae bacterium]|nr:HD domain-containing protein [Fimbriimonadaceae bacterium]
MMSPQPKTVSPRAVTFETVRTHPKVLALVDGANEVMMAMGFTEHGRRHVGIVAEQTGRILTALRHPDRDVELGQIAGYLHDIGNCIARLHHPMHGAAMAFTLLNEMGLPAHEIAPVIGAIGNHEEVTGGPVSAISAALNIADKADVHRARVQNPVYESFDIHDRVNYAVVDSALEVQRVEAEIVLRIEIDTSLASVMEYFEIFLSRMVMCRKSAEKLGMTFALSVNGTRLE